MGFPVDRDHLGPGRFPAVERHLHQLLLQHVAGVGKEGERADGVEHALVLGRNQARASGSVLQAPHLDPDPGQDAQAQHHQPGPHVEADHDPPPRREQQQAEAQGEGDRDQVEPGHEQHRTHSGQKRRHGLAGAGPIELRWPAAGCE